jgi:hypothetical protein
MYIQGSNNPWLQAIHQNMGIQKFTIYKNLEIYKLTEYFFIVREEIFKTVKSMSNKKPSQSKIKIWFITLKSQYIWR